MEEKYI